MGNRLLFMVKHKGKCLAYLYQTFGAGDGPELERILLEIAEKNKLDLTIRENAVDAMIKAGVEHYGHVKWNGTEICEGDPDDWVSATEEDRRYRNTHQSYFGNHIEFGNCDQITCFCGTGDGYPSYILSWCEDEYTVDLTNKSE